MVDPSAMVVKSQIFFIRNASTNHASAAARATCSVPHHNNQTQSYAASHATESDLLLDLESITIMPIAVPSSSTVTHGQIESSIGMFTGMSNTVCLVLIM